MSEIVQITLRGAIVMVLTKGKSALVDAEDWGRVGQFKWSLYGPMRNGSYYVARIDKQTRKSVYLHRFIVEAKRGEHVDHRSGNGLDNRRCNLRKCTPSQNHANHRKFNSKSGFKGVCWDKAKQKYLARITVNYKGIHLGRYHTAKEAADAYDAAARRYFGEFAATNDQLQRLTS